MKTSLRKNSLFFWLLLILSFSIYTACQKNTTTQIPGGSNVQTIRDVKYGSNIDWQGNDEDLLLDLYIPSTGDVNQKFPLVLFVHGGDFAEGDKAPAGVYLTEFAQNGYVGVSINYRLGWEHTSSCDGDTTQLKEAAYRAIQDTRAALRFLVAHAGEYNIDTNHIFLNGSSAGAVTVINCSFLTQAQMNMIIPGVQAKLGGLDNADNQLTDAYTIKGVSGVSGCIADSDFITSSNAIPLILFHGGQDQVVPYGHGYAHSCPNFILVDGSVSIYNRMTELGKPCVLHFDPNEGHIPYSDDFRFANQLCFFNSVLNEQTDSGYFEGTKSSCQ